MIFTRRHSHRRTGFTLVELLVAIAIIALLIGLTVKVVSKVRRAGWTTDTANNIMTIQNAINSYYADFHQYPGVVPNSVLNTAPGIKVISPFPSGFTNAGGANLTKITGTENLVLALYGGLYLDTTAGNAVTYDPSRVGTGAGSLNINNPKKSPAYLTEQKLLNESWWNSTSKDGHYKDDAGEANDSIVPELVDRFPQGMPILYLRANSGFQATGTITGTNNNVVTQYAPTAGQYQVEQMIGYTGGYTGTWPSLSTAAGTFPPPATYRYIGEQRQLQGGDHYALNGANIATPAITYHGLNSVKVTASITKGNPKFQYPYDAYPYLTNSTLSTVNAATPNSNDVARQKDSFILISPGPDRIYGTEDDITSFGSVGGD